MSKLHDIFIGNFPITQLFGVNYDTYKWIKDINGKSIKGHNGVDFGTSNNTPLLNPFPKTSEVIVSKVGFDEKGYGWFLRMWDKTQRCVVLYAHCDRIVVKEGDRLKFQQLVAYSDNTGWSTGPHLHFGFYEVDNDGNRLNRDNGFDGFLNPLSAVVEWQILNPQIPAHSEEADNILITKQNFEELVKKSTQWDEIVKYLEFSTSPFDTTFEDAKRVIAGLKSRITDLTNQLTSEQSERKNREEQVSRLKDQLTNEEKLRQDLTKRLNDTIQEIPGIQKVYEDRIKVIQGQLDEKSKELGEVKKELSLCQAGKTQNETIGNYLVNLLKSLKDILK